MREKLIKLLENAYAPYSKFQVASIVVTKNGQEFSGVNVENCSYGAAVCAERNAINSAISAGYKAGDFSKIYTMSSGQQLVQSCFICRQVISEFFEEDAEVITMLRDTDTTKSYLVKELCPHAFTKEHLS